MSCRNILPGVLAAVVCLGLVGCIQQMDEDSSTNESSSAACSEVCKSNYNCSIYYDVGTPPEDQVTMAERCIQKCEEAEPGSETISCLQSAEKCEVSSCGLDPIRDGGFPVDASPFG